MSPLVSVIIPTFNRAAFVLQAIESVLAQTYSAFEIIVVDDGSTDATETELQPFGRRIRYLRQANAGPASARNTGIKESRGSLVGFLDSDDAWRPRTLESVVQLFQRHPEAGLVSIMARETDADGHETARIYGKKSQGAEYSTLSLLGPDSGGCSWFFVRRPLLLEVGGFDETLRSAEECDLVLRLSFITGLMSLREPLLLRRRHDGNLSVDQRLNARSWIRLLLKLRRERAAFVRRHPVAYFRKLSRVRVRLGRELLIHESHKAPSRAAARRQLGLALLSYPLSVRALLFLLCATLAPRSYGRWRTLEKRLGGRA